MKIIYKDVGQGDSVILEWNSDGTQRVGIIDCNLKGLQNPVLEYLIANNYSEIEFIILSHPHRDHYSGFLELLEYVETKSILIKRFGHTLDTEGRKFWKYYEVDSKDSKILNKIIGKWKTLKEKGIIERMDNLVDGKTLKLVGGMELECLAPSHDDKETYQRIVKLKAEENLKEASQAANYLSTIFRLNVEDKYILFTSDAEISALEGVIKREAENFNKSVFHVCQLPHHGSEKNYNADFWKKVKCAKEKHAIASAGKHRSYNHPSFEVLKAFHENDYEIHCTNMPDAVSELTEYLKKVTGVSIELDVCSTLAEEYRLSNDKIFIINEQGKFVCV